MILIMNVSKKEYEKMVDKANIPGKNCLNYLKAFIVGGFVCVIGRWLSYLYLYWGLGEEEIKMAVPVTLILIAGILTMLKVYHKISKFAGAGVLVPITGFANAMVSPAMEAKTEGYVLGVGAKMFAISGPVIVYGTLSGLIYGFILLIAKAVM